MLASSEASTSSSSGTPTPPDSSAAEPVEPRRPRFRFRTACEACHKLKSSCVLRTTERSAGCVRCFKGKRACSFQAHEFTITTPAPPKRVISPTQTQELLFELSLNKALSTHLLQTYHYHSVRAVEAPFAAMAKIRVLERTPRIFDCEYDALAGADEVLALACMLHAATISTHSAVLGPRGIELTPHETKETIPFQEHSWASRARYDVIRKLRAKLLEKTIAIVRTMGELDDSTAQMLYVTYVILTHDKEEILAFYRTIERVINRRLPFIMEQLQAPGLAGMNLRQVMRRILKIPNHCGAPCHLPYQAILTVLQSALPPGIDFPIATPEAVERLLGIDPAARAAQDAFVTHFWVAMTSYEYQLLAITLKGNGASSPAKTEKLWRLVDRCVDTLNSWRVAMTSHPHYMAAVEADPLYGPHHLLFIIAVAFPSFMVIVSGFYHGFIVPVEKVHLLLSSYLQYQHHVEVLRRYFTFWEWREPLMDYLPVLFGWFRGPSLDMWVRKYPAEVAKLLPLMRISSYSSVLGAELFDEIEVAARSHTPPFEKNVAVVPEKVLLPESRWMVEAALYEIMLPC